MESIPSLSIKKQKISLSITLAMALEEIFMSPPMREETVILIDGETKQDSSSETVSEVQINF